MVTRTATLRLQLIDAASGTSRKLAGELRGLEGALSRLGKSGTPEAKRLANQLEQLGKKSKAIGDFREARRGLKDMSLEMRGARSNVDRLATAFASATKPTAKMASDLKTARANLKLTSAAFLEQGRAVRTSERALQSYGVNSRQGISRAQQEIRNQLAQTIRKMRELDREARKPLPQQRQQPRTRQPAPQRGAGSPSAVGVAAGAAGGYVAHNAGGTAVKAFNLSVDFNQAEAFRNALGGDSFSEQDRGKMNAQAEQIGKDTRFTNADVITAQTNLLQGGIRSATDIVNTLKPVTDYALTMGITLEEAAETIRGTSQIRQIDLSNAEAISTFVDSLVWMAKNSGMNDDDVRQYIRYGGAPMKGVGISDDVASAIGMVLRRAGYRGDEAGVFTRTASAKLGAPTAKGRLALQSMGINYDDYVTWPKAFSVGGIGDAVEENLGMKIPQQMRDKISEYLDNETFMDESGEEMSVKADRGTFVSGIKDIIAPLWGEKMSVKDGQAIAGLLGRFHKVSAESVNTEKLFFDILEADPSQSQLNSFFTERQGGRAKVLADRKGDVRKNVDIMKKTPKGIANEIGTAAHDGLFGDFTRAVGAVETALTRAARDWEFITRPTLQFVDTIASDFAGLSDKTRRLIEVFAAGAVLLAGALALKTGGRVVSSLLGGGAAGAGGALSAAANSASNAGKLGAAAGVTSKAVKTIKILGPAAAVAGAGFDIYDAANDPKLTQAEKSERYTRAGVGAAGGIAGAKIGASIGAFGGPIGAAAGGLVGGVGGYFAGDKLGEYMSGAFASKDPTRAAGDQLAQETMKWHIAAQQGMREYVNALAKGGDDAEAKAAIIAAEIERIMSFEANPTVATASLERALALARQVAAVISGNPAVATPPAGGDASIKVDGARAKGGPVRKGGVYRVNEEGEELFVPGTDGTIVPHGASMSSGSRRGGGSVPSISIVIQNVHLGKGATEGDAERLAQILEAKLSRSAQTMFGGLTFGDA